MIRVRDGVLATFVWVALAAVTLAACTRSEAGRTARADEPKPIAVTTAVAIERSLPRTLEVTGALIADAQTEVPAEIAGRVIEVLVERGAAVRASAPLARLDDQDAASQLREAEAIERQTEERLGIAGGEPFDATRTPDVRRARLVMERADAEYRRWERLVADGMVSRSEFEQKQTDYTTARAQVDASTNQMRELYQVLHAQRARVAMARKALADTVVRAPFDGVVAEKHASVGQYLARGGRVATVVRIDPLRVELAIPETAAGAVRRGQRVRFSVQTHPGRVFDGTVAYVGPALRSETRALVAEALVPNASGALQPGLFATARVELPANGPSVMVPASAVRIEAGVARAFVVHGDRAELRLVQAGTALDGWLEIARGVRAGERVVSPLVEGLDDGIVVTDSRREGK
jgi:membrane fusion protein, multidrug efflux system